MCTIVEKLGKNTRMFHTIENETPTNPKTLSSYLLLKNYYQEMDISFSYANDWRYYYIVRRYFLRKKKKENGGFWTCHYCGEHITKIQDRNTVKIQKGCITVDHVIPVSSGYDDLDISNMVECCYKCNIEKAATSYDDFINKKGIKQTTK
jgi:hypothetical protein